MIELTNALKATLYERAKKPFTGTFTLAWIVINWRIVFTILFVDENKLDGLTKIEHIEQCYINWGDNLWYPLLWTLILTFLLPILNLGALFIKKWFEKIEFKQILKKEAIDGSQYGDLLENIESQERHFTEKIFSLDERNKESKRVADNLSSERSRIKDTLDSKLELIKLKDNDIERLEKKFQTINIKLDKQIILINELSIYIKGYRKLIENYILHFDKQDPKIAKLLKGNIQKYDKENQRAVKNYL